MTEDQKKAIETALDRLERTTLEFYIRVERAQDALKKNKGVTPKAIEDLNKRLTLAISENIRAVNTLKAMLVEKE